MKKKQDIIYSTICIITSLLFIFWLIPAYTSKSIVRGDISSAAIPKALMYVILACGAIMLIIALLRKGKTDVRSEETTGAEWKKLIFVLCLVMIYIMAIKYVGFYVSTIIALPVSLKFFNKNMRWRAIIFSSLTMLVVIYLLFEKGLAVQMPRGLLL